MIDGLKSRSVCSANGFIPAMLRRSPTSLPCSRIRAAHQSEAMHHDPPGDSRVESLVFKTFFGSGGPTEVLPFPSHMCEQVSDRFDTAEAYLP